MPHRSRYRLLYRQILQVEKSINSPVGRSWFITGNFISMRKWEPNFVPSESKVDTTTIWVRLLHLPIEFYDASILHRIGKKIENLLKVDACTKAILRGIYAIIYVQIPLDTPVIASILIGHYSQPFFYEG